MLEHLLVSGLSPQRSEMVRSVLSAALNAADPRLAVRRALSLQGDALQVARQELDLSRFQRILLVGIGKAAQAMARGVLDILGARVSQGVVIAKHLVDGGEPLPERIRVIQGAHPVPTQNSVASAQAIRNLLQDSRPDDLVLCLISGGGSALATLPVEGTSLEEMQQLTRQLLACGADIGEINTLRKHLDQLKGGGLARWAAPARLVTLILSDVIGSPLDVIASGPTVADPSTFAQARQILEKYQLLDQAPPGILSILERGGRGELPETVKPEDSLLEGVINLIVGSNSQAAQAGLEKAARHGLNTQLLTTYLQGEASQAGIFLASLLKQIQATGQPLTRPACIAAGGETTVTLRGRGLGGRNQELALGAVALLSDLEDVALVTLGTDGEDGPTSAAGAVATGDTYRRARAAGLDPLTSLRENDSYHFFQGLGDLIITGPTGTNVNDLVFLFAF